MTATDKSVEGTHVEGTHVEGTHVEGTHVEGTHGDGDPRDESLTRLESEIGVLMWRAKRAMKVRGRMLHPDLPPGGYLMLTWLAERGPVRASALVDGLGIDKGAVSRMMQSMIDLGLLERHPDPEDGRASLVSVTAEARGGLDRVARERRVRFDDRLAEWSPGEINRLSAMLSRYNEALESQGS